jgi:hypothetical protein
MVIAIILYFIVAVLQYQTTTPTSYISQTEMEQIEQQQRMDSYPQFAYRLANIIEVRPEFNIYFKLEKNFIKIFDLTIYNNYLTIILLPIFLFGYFNLIKTNAKNTLLISLIPILTLTIFGHQNIYGPFVLYPIFAMSILFGIKTIIYDKAT